MTAARLSPTANLLRNSKLFALPPAIALPPSRPTAEPIASSDTATTIYPIKAALETPYASLKEGDWGLKRALPRKVATSSITPTIRLRKDIDTESHVADFDSTSDHVVTLRKWQNVNPQVVNTPNWGAKKADRRIFSVFHPEFDNTTSSTSDRVLNSPSAIPMQQIPQHLQEALEQLRSDQQAKAEAEGRPLPSPQAEPRTRPIKSKRWRYQGPWLAGMSNLEFDMFLKKKIGKRMSAWNDFLLLRQADMDQAATKATSASDAADSPARKTHPLPKDSDVGRTGASDNVEASEKSLGQPSRKQHLRDLKGQLTLGQLQQRLNAIKKRLRANRMEFATVIADFLDLPDGPARTSTIMTMSGDGEWNYARNTAATRHYRDVGPPRTHPSAGFSYVRSTQHARNDPSIGPTYPLNYLPARLLKDSLQSDASGNRRTEPSIGVGGLLARRDVAFSSSGGASDQWRPVSGGPKLVVKLAETSVQQDGGIEVGVTRDKAWELDEDNVPYNKQDYQRELLSRRKLPEAPDRLEQLDQPSRSRSYYRKAEPLDSRAGNLDEDAADIVAAMEASFNRGDR
jgi:Mitochondrial ribosomal protein subunit